MNAPDTAADQHHAMPTPSTSREQLVQLIRFNLDELSSTNGHHRFEDLCRHFARERLAPNILPATGPVAAGGDRGRDFETFRSYIRKELGPYGAFAGALNDGSALAFLCTLQRDGVPSKILADVEKVMAAGPPVSTIYALLATPLVKAKRDAIQDCVRNAHDVHLEVLDGRALAESLADPKIFWIAEQFLSIPASMRPVLPEGDASLPAWYASDRDRWRERERVAPRMGELLDVIDGLRHATFHAEARDDLPFWLDLVRPLASDDTSAAVRQRARYEVAASQLRGMGNLRPADDLALAFLRELATCGDDPSRLQDGAGLLSYATTAVVVGHSDIDASELADINDRLRERVRGLLADSPPRTRRARLLEVLGHLAVIPVVDNGSGATRESFDAPALIDQARAEGVPEEIVAALPARDIDEVMRAWTELAELLEETPLYPVESWAEVLDFLSPLLLRQPGWERIAHAVDAALARVTGGDAAAERARDRALRLLDGDHLLRGLRELHRAVLRWWSGDSLRPALLCMLGVADVYKRLRLPQAAKQYALAVAAGAQASGDDVVTDLVPHAILMASEMDYAAGAWMSAIEHVDVGLIAQYALVDADVDQWAARDFQNAVMTVGMALRAAEQLTPEVLPAVEAVAQRHGMLETLRRDLRDAAIWDRETWSRIADEQLLGRPFDDLGRERVFRFAALGLEWIIRSDSEYRTVRAAERLAAAAQILSAEMADDDLRLVPGHTEVVVRLSENSVGRRTAERDVASPRCPWIVELTPLAHGQAFDEKAHFTETLTVLVHILSDASLLPPKTCLERVVTAFERDLGGKLALGRPFEELAEVVSAKRYAATPRDVNPPLPDGRPDLVAHPELAFRPRD